MQIIAAASRLRGVGGRLKLRVICGVDTSIPEVAEEPPLEIALPIIHGNDAIFYAVDPIET